MSVEIPVFTTSTRSADEGAISIPTASLLLPGIWTTR